MYQRAQLRGHLRQILGGFLRVRRALRCIEPGEYHEEEVSANLFPKQAPGKFPMPSENVREVEKFQHVYNIVGTTPNYPVHSTRSAFIYPFHSWGNRHSRRFRLGPYLALCPPVVHRICMKFPQA